MHPPKRPRQQPRSADPARHKNDRGPTQRDPRAAPTRRHPRQRDDASPRRCDPRDFDPAQLAPGDFDLTAIDPEDLFPGDEPEPDPRDFHLPPDDDELPW